MNTQYKHRGGWAASFLIVGILLTLAVLGGLYYIKANQQKLASSDKTSTTSKTTTTTINPDKTSTSSTGVVSQNDTTKKGETVDTNTSKVAQDPLDDEAGADAEAATDAAANANTSQPTTPSSPKTTSPTAKSNLPTTVPEDTLFNAAIITLLTFVAATYVRSRYASREL